MAVRGLDDDVDGVSARRAPSKFSENRVARCWARSKSRTMITQRRPSRASCFHRSTIRHQAMHQSIGALHRIQATFVRSRRRYRQAQTTDKSRRGYPAEPCAVRIRAPPPFVFPDRQQTEYAASTSWLTPARARALSKHPIQLEDPALGPGRLQIRRPLLQGLVMLGIADCHVQAVAAPEDRRRRSSGTSTWDTLGITLLRLPGLTLFELHGTPGPQYCQGNRDGTAPYRMPSRPIPSGCLADRPRK